MVPAVTATDGDLGVALHGGQPLLDRPLAVWRDDVADVDAGPSILEIAGAGRLVAVGHFGDNSPLNPDAPGAGGMLRELVGRAASTAPRIDRVEVEYSPGAIEVAASATGGTITGTGVNAVPAPWTPAVPVVAHHDVRLLDEGRLVDLVRLPANPVDLSIADGQFLIDGEVHPLTGMSLSEGLPDGTADELGAIQRRDFSDMRANGVTAYRVYGPASDWLRAVTARNGILLADALSIGWLLQVDAAAIERQLPRATFVGARAVADHNHLTVNVGNEFLDPNAAASMAAIEKLASAVRRGGGDDVRITYGAAHHEPMLLGELPFLDVYSVNCYGATYPTTAPDPAFVLCVQHAKAMAGDRPVVISEWGSNTFLADAAQQIAAYHVGADLSAQEMVRAELIVSKWELMRALGVAGGFAFQWADVPEHGFFIPNYREMTGVVEYPPGSGYHPIRHEAYWGFHDVHRTPRLALDASAWHAYNGAPGPWIPPVG